MSGTGSRRVLVTAGASGIGRAIALAFAGCGARVHICDIDEVALQGTPTGISVNRCDVSDRADVEHTILTAIEELGGLDVLVNNAGIAGATAPVEQFSPESWRRVLDVNLTGTFNVTQLAIPHLRKSRAGAIINMSALGGRLGYPNRSAYSVSKWGLVGFTKTLAMELGECGIRVNAILPGPVNGERLQAVLRDRAIQSGRSVEEEATHAMRMMSIKQWVEPEHIGALAVFLASDAASMISGQVFPIDGDTQSIA